MSSRRHRSPPEDLADVLRQIEDQTRDPASHDWDQLAFDVTEAAIAHMCDPTTPRLTIGKFDVIVDVGRGGFGIVFKAHDPELDRPVALKLCRARPSAIDALLDEARLQAKLDRYPNIVTIYDHGRHDGAAFIAMQFIAGQNAEQFAKRDPAPSVQEILRVYLHVARGLAAAHAEGIVHGDVKPSNFVLDSDDFAYIADFGLARRMIENADECEQEGLRRRAGTLYYMAPEALCGKPCSAGSDQFSFFVALCQTLARGKLPFYGRTSGEVLDAIEHTDISQFLGPWVSAELEAVILIGLSLDPNDRFPDMETVEAELGRLLQTLPPSSPPHDEPEPDESDEPEDREPERMHGPPDDPRDRYASMDADDLERAARGVITLRPGVGAPASKAKRGSFAASLALVGLMLGWLGRGQVEPARVSEPTPAPAASPCAMVASDPNVGSKSALIPTCARIRAGSLSDAAWLWDVEFTDRRRADPGEPAPTSSELAQLRAETLIVARTFVDQAERMSRWAWVAQTIQGTAKVLGWRIPDDPIVAATDYAEDWLVQTKQYLSNEGLGPEDPDLQDVRKRVDRLRSEGYSQHSTNPSSSRYP